MSNIKLKLRYNNFEVDYDGPQDFLSDPVLVIVREALTKPITQVDLPPGISEPISAPLRAPADTSTPLTLNALAARLRVTSGPELIVAAVARLVIFDGRDRVTRKHLLEEMRSASSYFKSTYRSNLSNYLNRLIKDGRILEVASDTYALPARVRDTIEEQIKQLG